MTLSVLFLLVAALMLGEVVLRSSSRRKLGRASVALDTRDLRVLT